MVTDQLPAEEVMPVDLDGISLTRQVEIGERVKTLIEHAGFDDLCEVLKIHRDGLVAMLIHRKPDSDAASYADIVGHLRGLDEIVPLALGIVENGKNAAAELRGAEEESP